MSQPMLDSFPAGLLCGLAVGLALAVIMSRLSSGVRWLSSLLGRDPILRKLKDAEDRAREARSDAEALRRRVEEKDAYIRKAMASLAAEKAAGEKKE